MINLAKESFPVEDVALFEIICKLVALLPERLDLMAENETEEDLLYDPKYYYEMLAVALADMLNLEMSTIIVGNPRLLADALNLPGGGAVILGIPGSICSGPILLRKGNGIVFTQSSGAKEWGEVSPHWFQIGVDYFREAIQARINAEEQGEQTQPI